MIKLTIIDGRTYAIRPDAVARLIEAETSKKRQGIHCYVRTFDGDTLEVLEDIPEIMRMIRSTQMGQHDQL